ncbi:hypothetical protein [Nonomuraea terrae]|uniref:hypothetical protein n=1 Tax=Nonomuraea terrae TaxID=2530383 RepID=UPI0014042888|nr:hypothetical protein [Nonomuraea terrae]
MAEELRPHDIEHDIELESLRGPLQGVYRPSGHGAALLAFGRDHATTRTARRSR